MCDDSQSEGVEPRYTYVIAGDGLGAGANVWDKFVTTTITSAPGVIVALFAVWFTHRLTRKREATTAQRTLELALQRYQFEKSEAIRKEATQRKLNALEQAAKAIFAARAEIRKLANDAEQSKFPEHDFGPLAEGCAFLHIHFGARFSVEVTQLEDQYGECIKCVSQIALAAFWLSRRREEGDVDMVSAQYERQNYEEAKRQYREQAKVLDGSLAAMLVSLKDEAQSIVKAGGEAWSAA